MKYSLDTLAVTVLCSSLIATAWQALSSRALDNLTIPLSIAFVLYYFLVPSAMQNAPGFVRGVGLGLAIAVAAYYVHFLTANGAVATFLLASFVFGIGGWKWAVPILAFFVLSSILSKIRKQKRKEFELVFEKAERRDYGQVAANGGVAGGIVLLQYLFQSVNFYPAYLGAIAAVTADTWSTEIGTYFNRKTVSITSFKEVEPGTNGGVSFAGLLGGFLGSVMIALSAMPWAGNGMVLTLVTVSGSLGSVVDSIVGATIQARYTCSICGKITERKVHCGETARLIGGFRSINNDAVNWVCALSGALIVLLFL